MSTRIHLPLVPTPPMGGRERTPRGRLEAPPEASEGEELLQVGELARAAGRTVRAIHLYEELGLLRSHTRSKGQYRLFDRGALERVRWIAKMQELGLTLGEIQTIVREWETAPSAPGAMRLMRDTYEAKLSETRAQIEKLRALEAELSASLDYLETCGACEPVVLLSACSCCERHDEPRAPGLVEGFRAGHRPGCEAAKEETIKGAEAPGE